GASSLCNTLLSPNNEFIAGIFADIDHARIQNQVLTLNTLQLSTNDRGLVKVVGFDLFWILLDRINEFASRFIFKYFNRFIKLEVLMKFFTDRLNFWCKLFNQLLADLRQIKRRSFTF